PPSHAPQDRLLPATRTWLSRPKRAGAQRGTSSPPHCGARISIRPLLPGQPRLRPRAGLARAPDLRLRPAGLDYLHLLSFPAHEQRAVEEPDHPAFVFLRAGREAVGV